MSDYIKEIFFHIKGTPTVEEAETGTYGNYIKATLHYDLGGYNLFTYKSYPRGYYLGVNKIGYGQNKYSGNVLHWESFRMSKNSGANYCIIPCNRKSKKKEAEAVAYFDENIMKVIARMFPDDVLDPLE